MSNLITQCPSCRSVDLQIVKVECKSCLTRFEGQFDINPLLKLSDEELQFVIDFVKCSGSLKEMASLQNVSYPTLRNRLNALISNLVTLEIAVDNAKDQVLQLLEEGKISAKEAAIMLKKL